MNACSVVTCPADVVSSCGVVAAKSVVAEGIVANSVDVVVIVEGIADAAVANGAPCSVDVTSCSILTWGGSENS